MIVWSGVVVFLSGIVGYLLGGYIIKRLNLSTGHLLRSLLFLALICTTTVVMFTIQCETARLADITNQLYIRHTDT